MIIHIGYHKTGTTWLQKCVFAHHPNMFAPFSLDELNELIILPSSYAFDPKKVQREIHARTDSSERIPIISHERLSGDPFSGGRDSKEMADRIYGLFPDARIIIVLREQIDVIASVYKQYVLTGGCGTVSQFMSRPEEGRAEYRFFDAQHYCYDALVRYYTMKFGTENVLVLFYEDLRHDWEKFLSCLLMAVGVNPGYRPQTSEKIHVSLSDTSTKLLTFFNRFGRTYQHPAPLVEMDWIRRYGRSMLYRTNKLWHWLPIERSVKDQVQLFSPIEKFRESNRRLKALVNRDVGELGYMC